MPDIPFMNLDAIHAPLRQELLDACARVIDSQRFIGGGEVAKLEQTFCELTGTAHAIGVSSGTDALLAALMAADIGPGDEVITTPFTFFAWARRLCLSMSTRARSTSTRSLSRRRSRQGRARSFPCICSDKWRR
jgi:dTDP-4-amino-4,6-dideoxygalactose transaminase